MAWKSENSVHEKAMAEINITPLTDVMLVLLVIFMVTTPLIMAESFKVKLPKAVTSDTEKGKGAIVAISAKGLLNVNGKDVGFDGLYNAMKKEFASNNTKNVVIKADGAVQHAVVVKVLDIAKLAGAEKFSIATERQKESRK